MMNQNVPSQCHLMYTSVYQVLAAGAITSRMAHLFFFAFAAGTRPTSGPALKFVPECKVPPTHNARDKILHLFFKGQLHCHACMKKNPAVTVYPCAKQNIVFDFATNSPQSRSSSGKLYHGAQQTMDIWYLCPNLDTVQKAVSAFASVFVFMFSQIVHYVYNNM